MIEETGGIKGPECLIKVEELLKQKLAMVAAAIAINDFAQADIQQQHVTRLQLRLAETKNRKDRLTRL